jgi:hypothetical protein
MNGDFGGEAEDLPTRRLGTYLAILAGVVFVARLVGIGPSWAYRIDLIALLSLWAALSLRNGKRWGRTVLVALTLIGVAFTLLIALFADIAFGFRVLLAWGLLSLALELCAIAFTLPEEGAALGLPEAWRPWATSNALHLFILVIGLLGALTGY